MADPTLTSSSVRIKYTSSDGYKMEVDFNNPGPKKAEPQQMLLDGIEEAARILALFGYEAEARAAVEGAFTRVSEWRANREAQNGN